MAGADSSFQKPVLTRRRSASDSIDGPAKKSRFDTSSPHFPIIRDSVSLRVPTRDKAFLRQVIKEIEQRQDARGSHGGITNKLVHALLTRSKTADDGIDVHFWSGSRASVEVESGNVSILIVVESQQLFQWSSLDRPISQLFHRMRGFHREVSVQIPSRDGEHESFESRTLREVRERFLKSEETEDPWNVLDLHNPLPSTLPAFLMGANCQLLSQVRDLALMGNSAERPIAAIKTWNEWKNVLEWILLCEGGHNTAPHMDSHGFSTWLTVQEGHVGFGWMSRPTKQELDEWISDPQDYTGGRWRYVVLRPGQTIFFTSGTIHYVFRLSKGQTLMFGGHILQWSSIEPWMEVIIAQIKNPDITNEDMESSVGKHIEAVADLVHEERSVSNLDKETARKFLKHVNDFHSLHRIGLK
ncbi:hypothetical protein LOZ65_006529 [Ophidiomyces ophidiicola]|nr:hypothetical protein LOZ65_006529 [Ophidiomyces ophidiicola]